MKRLAPLVLVLVGCATTPPPAWVPTASPYIARTGQFQVDLPDGWMRRDVREGELLLVTRVGTAVQRILAGSSELGKPFAGTKRAVVAGMTPQDAGAVVLEDLNALDLPTFEELVKSFRLQAPPAAA